MEAGFFRRSVRGRLASLVVAIAVPAAVLVGLLAFQAYRNQRDVVSEQLLATSRGIAAAIDTRIVENRAVLMGLAASPSLARGEIDRFRTTIESLNLGPGRWIVLADAAGQQLINPQLPAGTPLPRNPFVLEHERAIAEGRTYLSNIIIGRVGRLVMFVSVPVFIDNRHRYTLTYVTEPAIITEPVRNTAVPSHLIVAALDRKGTIGGRSPELPNIIGQKAVPRVTAAVMQGYQGITEGESIEGKEVLAAISRAPQSGWSVVVGASYADVYAPARMLLWTGLGMALVLLAVATGMALWIARSLVRGVDALVADTEAVARGVVPPEQRDGLEETAFVSDAVRRMALEIQARDRENSALYYLVERVNRAAELPDIYSAALEAALTGHGADGAAILILDKSGMMHCKASRGLVSQRFGSVDSKSLWSSERARRSPIWWDDLRKTELWPELRSLAYEDGIAALAFVPLTARDELLGQLTLYYREPHAFTATELKPVETLASQIGFAIERQLTADELESLVEERTASLRDAMAQMEEFSYSVSHDLRAPIRAVHGYTLVLLEDYAAEWAAAPRDLLVRIERSSRRMDRMIQDLLAFTRVTRHAVRLEPLSPERLILEVREQYPEIGRADFAIETPLPPVIASEPLLAQVFSNLLTNAVKFVRGDKQPEIRVGAERRGDRVRLWVRDNGIGIRPELKARLFQMFERVHTERHYEGTGIGLAIVRKAVERMHGAVGVESDGSSGSTFWIELPAATEEAEADRPLSHVPSPEARG